MLLSGYMPLTLWRHLSNRTIFIFRGNVMMLFHRRISLIDIFLTMVALEFVGCTMAFIVNYGALVAIGVMDPIEDYGMVAAGWITMAVLATAVGAAIAVLTEKYEASERFVQPMQYLLLPISGFLFMVDWLPDNVQKIAWWMPMIHCFEMVRAGFFGDSVTTHFTPAYPLLFGLVLLAICLPMFESTREHLHV
jgi:capsular polysaccharide transport system permease protein